MRHDTHTIVGSGGMELFAQSWLPDGKAKAVMVIIHGFGEHSGRYTHVGEWFAARQYAVYGFDLRGMGRSPGKRGHVNDWTEYTEDVRSYVQWVKESSPGLHVFLWGHSQGGLIALDYSIGNPEGLSGVIASGPSVGSLPVSPLMLTMAKLMSRIWPQFTQDVRLDVNALSRDQSIGRAYASDPLVHNKATARMGTEMMKAIDRVQDHACDLSVPCFVIHGGGDKLSPVQGSQAFCDKLQIDDWERKEYEGFFHELHNETEWQLVLEDMQAWIENRLIDS